eukprot:scaffold97994_cov25-Tisochrysis_lutea.AAC.1
MKRSVKQGGTGETLLVIGEEEGGSGIRSSRHKGQATHVQGSSNAYARVKQCVYKGVQGSSNVCARVKQCVCKGAHCCFVQCDESTLSGTFSVEEARHGACPD